MHILVTGGTGTLGRVFASAAAQAGHDVRIMSRRTRPTWEAAHLGVAAPGWAQADLKTGEGVREAVEGMDAVLHAATSPGLGAKKVDVEGTRRLLDAAQAAGVGHFMYPSIVGIDEIPLGYYRRKREAERLVKESPVPHTLLRATQFHAFVDQVFSALASLPLVALLPTDFQMQSVAASEVAQHLARHVERPGERLADFGGPEVSSVGEQARIWLEAHAKRRRLVRLPLPGKTARAFRRGANTAPQHRQGEITWREWLDQDAQGA